MLDDQPAAMSKARDGCDAPACTGEHAGANTLRHGALGQATSGAKDAVVFPRPHGPLGWVRFVLASGLILMVRLYQATLSHWLGGRCRFVPSCSEYFIDAIRKRGPWVGTLKGLWRILRCNPFCKGGFDPVE